MTVLSRMMSCICSVFGVFGSKLSFLASITCDSRAKYCLKHNKCYAPYYEAISIFMRIIPIRISHLIVFWGIGTGFLSHNSKA